MASIPVDPSHRTGNIPGTDMATQPTNPPGSGGKTNLVPKPTRHPDPGFHDDDARPRRGLQSGPLETHLCGRRRGGGGPEQPTAGGGHFPLQAVLGSSRGAASPCCARNGGRAAHRERLLALAVPRPLHSQETRPYPRARDRWARRGGSRFSMPLVEGEAVCPTGPG